ncbi:uncharacterized protein CBL_03436 [Carabus blaptoides fortunei]
MVATNDKVQFDFNADFGDSNYKSCFARSVVVNSQFQTKSLDLRQLQKVYKDEQDKRINPNNVCTEPAVSSDVMRLRKDCQPDGAEMVRRLSCCSISSGTGTKPARRGSDLPVENIALQSQVDMLQWQLKQAEASREMYRAVMQQVVSFLERAHRSLDLLSEKQRVVQRTRSEYHVAGAGTSISTPTPRGSINETPEPECEPQGTMDGYTAFRDFTWRRPKRQQTSPDEIPPEKLSQEAFRLLRTAQSLIHTREPNLAHISSDLGPKDQEFLSQLAREFPSRPQRATSFSVNPQLISPSDRDIRISTAFNRKLSLQRTPMLDGRRDSLRQEASKKTDVPRNLENDFSLLNDAESIGSKRSSVTSIPSVSSVKKNVEKPYFETVKGPSPKTGSVSSAEDESGFSSMNSFQEVGLPLINASVLDSEAPFKNGDVSVNSSDSNITQIHMNAAHSNSSKTLDKSKLIWNRSDLGLPITHRRWSSTPVEVVRHDPLKVLWV